MRVLVVTRSVNVICRAGSNHCRTGIETTESPLTDAAAGDGMFSAQAAVSHGDPVGENKPVEVTAMYG